MWYSKEKNTFILVCPVDTCSLRCLKPHQLIYRYGGEMWKEWRKTSWTTTYEENWFSVKNKVPYKNRAPKTKKTFRDQQELKSAALQIKMNGK